MAKDHVEILYNRENGIDRTKPIFNAGIEFIDENGGGPGVRLRKRTVKRNKQRYPTPSPAFGILSGEGGASLLGGWRDPKSLVQPLRGTRPADSLAKMYFI